MEIPVSEIVQPTSPLPVPETGGGFDIRTAQIQSFAALQEARAGVFSSRNSRESFERTLDTLEEDGDGGLRKGLGLWMLGDYQRASRQLASYEDDDVASFTLANSLMSLRRPADAAPIFQRLSEKYPAESKPRGGYLLARLEARLAECDPHEPEPVLEELRQLFEGAPEGFEDTADGQHLLGRAAELRRDWETAIDHFLKAREFDPGWRINLFRMAHRAERCGLEELALEGYEALMKNKPVEVKVMMNLGVLYEDLGRDQEAATCYDTVTKCYPMNRHARLYLADAKAGMDMYYDEDLERKEDRLNQILRIPITDFELSVRARNCLNKMNIMTLGDLVKKTEQELLSYKNFGETSLNEIKEILGSKGLRLGMAREEAVMSIESTQQRYTTGENIEAMNRPIADLELSIRARRTVEGLGCLTLGDVIQHTEDELLGMPNFGVTSLQELKEKLTEFSLNLKPKA
jgi:DNA-directed RNA polymerase subunit alpha